MTDGDSIPGKRAPRRSLRRPPRDDDRKHRPENRRIRRERRTVEVMIRMYCAGHHLPGDATRRGEGAHAGRTAALCAECDELLEYALGRVDACPFGESKPACARCTVHCFRPEMRGRIRAVMGYAGPRMTLRHPYLAIRHLLDRRSV